MSAAPTFHPHAIPRPNMLVQSGTKVLIKDLSSETGFKLNGRTGTALQFYSDRDGRWSVELDQDENKEQPQLEQPDKANDTTATEESNGKVVLIRINNLELVPDQPFHLGVVKRDNFDWAALSQGGTVVLLAGTSAENMPAICLLEGKDGGFDAEQIYKMSEYMGIPSKAIPSIVEKIAEANALL